MLKIEENAHLIIVTLPSDLSGLRNVDKAGYNRRNGRLNFVQFFTIQLA